MSGKLVISLDFEKYWGVRDKFSIDDYRTNLDNVDKVVLKTLEIFRKNKIHATWAVVGFLFCKNRDDLVSEIPSNTNLYNDNEFDPYDYIKNNDLEHKYHFSNDMIRSITKTPYQEVASHTFSHYYCLEDGQDKLSFDEDCKQFNKVSSKLGIQVKTIIFPRNQVNEEYKDIMQNNGIISFRGNEENIIFRPTATKSISILIRAIRFLDRYVNLSGHHAYTIDNFTEPVNVKSSRFLSPYNGKLKMFEKLKLKRIKKSMFFAAKNNLIYHIWWHPHNFGRDIDENLNVLREIVEYYNYLNLEYGFESKTINEVSYLEV